MNRAFVDNDSSNSLKKTHTSEGARDKFMQYDYTRTVEETRVKESDPGKILSGAGMMIVADKLLMIRVRLLQAACWICRPVMWKTSVSVESDMLWTQGHPRIITVSGKKKG